VKRLIPLVSTVAALTGCSPEARSLGPSVPQTAPSGNNDPRISAYQDNFYQLSQGGRYFSWYGCSGCHNNPGRKAPNLARGAAHGNGFAQVYASIASRHGALRYDARVPVEQLWQLTAYVRDLPRHTPEKRRRVQVDQNAEPVGSSWSGPQ
jgi:hypothetical protein